MREQAAMGPGVLRPRAAAGRFTLARYEPEPALAPFVDFYWIVRWDLRGQPPHEQSILPHPTVNLAFEAEGAQVYGVDRRIFTRRLSGAGHVLGARFRPGCFRPLCGGPVRLLNDQVVPAPPYFGPAVTAANAAVMSAASGDEMIAAAAAVLGPAMPPRDPVAERVAEMVERIGADRDLRRVGQLAAAFGLPERRMQRLFSEYVGVSPKWVLRRARLHEAALRADGGEEVDWAALAASLGYADQSHLTRDFTATLGVAPARYAGRH